MSNCFHFNTCQLDGLIPRDIQFGWNCCMYVSVWMVSWLASYLIIDCSVGFFPLPLHSCMLLVLLENDTYLTWAAKVKETLFTDTLDSQPDHQYL